MEYLFSYGTLQKPLIQLLILGRIIKGTPDVLDDYEKITHTLGPNTYPIIRPQAGAQVDGTAYEVEADDLPKLDHYETTAYHRIRVTLRSGIEAWAYCAPE